MNWGEDCAVLGELRRQKRALEFAGKKKKRGSMRLVIIGEERKARSNRRISREGPKEFRHKVIQRGGKRRACYLMRKEENSSPSEGARACKQKGERSATGRNEGRLFRGNNVVVRGELQLTRGGGTMTLAFPDKFMSIGEKGDLSDRKNKGGGNRSYRRAHAATSNY